MGQEIVYDFDTVVSRAGTFSEKYEARERYFGDAEVEPFWVADMDLPSPAFLVEALRERLAHPMFGYTEQYDAVFDSIRWWMQSQHGAEVERKWISLSPSVVTSISLAIQAMTDPGDSVIVLSPVYGPFFFCTEHNHRNVIDCPLPVNDGRFEMDFEALEKAVAQPSATLLMLCNPHNPGGRVWREAELVKIAQLCAENNVCIFSDEIHSDIVYPPNRHFSMLNVPVARENCIVAHSIGKTFNASGLQASFVMIPDTGIRKRFETVAKQSHVNDVNLMAKSALASALSPAGAEYKRQLNLYLQENTRLVCQRLQALEHVIVMEPEATFLVWFDLRSYGPWPRVMKRLIQEARVAFSGGTFFGPAGEGWFRINFAHPRSKLLPAVDRVVEIFYSEERN